MTLVCVIHYKNQAKYSNIKTLSGDNIQRIFAAKQLREKIGGDNLHAEQCSGIPDSFNESHGIHLEPCYKRYLISVCPVNCLICS